MKRDPEFDTGKGDDYITGIHDKKAPFNYCDPCVGEDCDDCEFLDGGQEPEFCNPCWGKDKECWECLG